MTHRLTWAAILVCVLLTVPAMLVGWVAASIYASFLLGYIGGDTILTWIGLDIIIDIFRVWFPEFLRGGVAGWLAMYITAKVFKLADYNAVAYSVSAIVILLAVFSIYIVVVQGRFMQLDTVAIIANTVGTVAGYWAERLQIQERQASYQASQE